MKTAMQPDSNRKDELCSSNRNKKKKTNNNSKR